MEPPSAERPAHAPPEQREEPATSGRPAASADRTDGADSLRVVSSAAGETIPLAYHPPVKRSVTIAGHQTSISLEPMFWTALEAEARRRHLAVNALVAQIDAARLHASRPPNLTSALRQFLFDKGGDHLR